MTGGKGRKMSRGSLHDKYVTPVDEFELVRLRMQRVESAGVQDARGHCHDMRKDFTSQSPTGLR